MIWTWEGSGARYPLHVAQFPGFRETFDEVAPEEVREFSPPFLGAMQEAGICCKSGAGSSRARHPAGACCWACSPTCHAASEHELYEGIVETDRWFGPLFTNLRLTKTNVPIEFRADLPAVPGPGDPARRL